MRQPRKNTWAYGSAMVGALFLSLLTFGTPQQVGCGGLPEEDGTVDGALDARLPAPLRVLLIWDGPDGSAFKLGEGTASGVSFSLAAPAAPPDAALVDGTLAVAHLVAVPQDLVLADGPLTADHAEGLTQGASGALAGYAVVYKAAESDRYPWLHAFPPGLSCAQARPAPANARPAGDAPLVEYAPVPCRGMRPALRPVDEAAFANWALPQTRDQR